LKHFDNDWIVKPKHDRRRHKVLACPTCGKKPLYFEEEFTNNWILAEFDENNKLVRHVCKMKFGVRAGR
jgi:uncharacterized protein YbaR (Trm112 family)